MPEQRIVLDSEKNEAIVNVDTDIFAPEVIYSAAYVYLDKAYFLFDGDFKKGIKVTIRPKEKGTDLKKLCHEFSNELINYSVYVIQAAKKQAIREAIIRRALSTNGAQVCEEKQDFSEESDDVPEEDVIDDPEGISKPWSPEDSKGLEKPE